MNRIIEKLKVIVSNLAMAIRSLFWKKDSSVVLVGAWFGDKFADNSRYLYQYLSENKSALGLTHVVWVTANEKVCNQLNEMGYESYLFGTKESIRYHKIAKYHMICTNEASMTLRYADGSSRILLGDIEGQYSWRAKKINVWHGLIGAKGAGAKTPEYREATSKHPVMIRLKELFRTKSQLYRKFFNRPGGWGDCYYLSTTPYRTDLLRGLFLLPKSRLIETGFPRVTGVIRYLPVEKQMLNIIKQYKYSIIYVPTFRSMASKDFDFNKASTELKSYLEKNNILWIQKGHSASNVNCSEPHIDGNIINLPAEFDINTIIPMMTLMITDYSSVAGDAIYYYKPIIYYVPDYDEYLKKDVGFQRDPNEIMCGPKVKSIFDLEKCIESLLFDTYHPDEKYMSVRKLYYNDKNSIDIIWQDIKNA